MNDGSMNNDEQKQSAERWLDAALDRYSDAEPRPGFETRLLARVAAEREMTPRWRAIWMWAAIASAAAVLVIVMTLGRINHQTSHPPAIAKSQPSQPQPSSATAAPNPVVTANATTPQRSERRIASRAVRRTYPVVVAANKPEQPRQPQFPTPAPLNEQERLLLAYVQSTPKQEIETVIAQKQAFQDDFDKLGVPQEQEKSDR